MSTYLSRRPMPLSEKIGLTILWTVNIVGLSFILAAVVYCAASGKGF